MTLEEYFGDWSEVIDKSELSRALRYIQSEENICPSKKSIFKAFKLCPYKELKVVFVGMDPYPQSGVAQGILFGNSKDTLEENLSPSLQVIKECAINYEIPRNTPVQFDNTLESWAKQGILLINSAFTCRVNEIGSHLSIWKPFTSKLIENISTKKDGLVFVLFGGQAQSFKSYIKGNHKVIETYHPAYYARRNEKMPYEVFTEVNKFLREHYNEHINFYIE